MSIDEPLWRKLGRPGFTHCWHAMLSCYTGDNTYALHLDNPHLSQQAQEGGQLPDNGLRLTLCYYINVHWDPARNYNGGGMDLFLTDTREPPATAAAARRAPRHRVAPHADTLAIFLSEYASHQVISTTGSETWFCLTMWCFDQEIQEQFLPKVMAQRGSLHLLGYEEEEENS